MYLFNKYLLKILFGFSFISFEGVFQNPNGGAGSPGQGGSQPGTGGNPNVNLLNLTSTGGLVGNVGVLMVFAFNVLVGNQVYKLDSTNFDCEEDCEYDFKVEEVEVYRQPTTDKVIIRYRDLGQCSLNLFFVGNVLGNVFASKIVTIVFGGKNDGKIKTATADLVCTFEAPQLIIQRTANSGPVSLTKVLVEYQHGDGKPI